jgi:hypothetical protein
VWMGGIRTPCPTQTLRGLGRPRSRLKSSRLRSSGSI